MPLPTGVYVCVCMSFFVSLCICVCGWGCLFLSVCMCVGVGVVSLCICGGVVSFPLCVCMSGWGCLFPSLCVYGCEYMVPEHMIVHRCTERPHEVCYSLLSFFKTGFLIENGSKTGCSESKQSSCLYLLQLLDCW